MPQATVPAHAGDTVAMALLDAGLPETTRSAKYRRPRGAYCLRGDCGSCLMRINGRPNQRACLILVAPHMRVEPQNRLLATGPDPSALVDRMLPGGLDHHHFMVRPKLANRIMQGVARELTGLGVLPDRIEPPAEHRMHRPEVLLVGSGAAGRAVAAALRLRPDALLWLDRRPWPAAEPQPPWLPSTGVFGVYPEEGICSAMTQTRQDGAPAILHTIAPRHVVFATGATDPTLPVPNNDLPGVVCARGLLAQLAASGARPTCTIVVVGDGSRAQQAAAALGARHVSPADVAQLEGSSQVEAVRMRDGTRMPAQLVAFAPTPCPAYELARQGGAAVRFDGAGFAVVVDAAGRCASDGPWTAWACGDTVGAAAGLDDAEQHAANDGRRVGEAVAASLARESTEVR